MSAVTMPVSSNSSNRKEPLIGAIIEGTEEARFVVYKAEDTREIVSCSVQITQICPQEGWLEHDPVEILQAVRECVTCGVENLEKLSYGVEDIVAVGISNQRETTIAWDVITGEPLYNAVVWSDIRTDSTVDQILAKVPENSKNALMPLCGLPISPYFSALKMRWLIDNVPAVRRAIREQRCRFGTVDTWLVWNLTGGRKGGLFITDVTNASRTMLMNIETLQWDPVLCRYFNIASNLLPEIRSSSEIYGHIKEDPLKGIPISSILGNQQSSLIGERCFKEGQAKSTYRKGCFLVYNTGLSRVHSTHGLETTVAYKMGKNIPAVYALEGSVAVAGSALKWLKNNLNILKEVSDSESAAADVPSTGDVYFVPAFSGLYAPYWRKDARGIICGLTQFTTRNHIIRAALEAVCFQTRDILEAMAKDCGHHLTKLQVDGKMTENKLLMQLQADLCGIPVEQTSAYVRMEALGVAMAAGQAEGIGVWDLYKEPEVPVVHDTFIPTTTHEERDARYSKWKMAVKRSLGWATTKKSLAMTDERYRLLSSIPPSWFLISSFGILVISSELKR
ncbi:glycerol kinase isoform X2 [Zootermopsis nevadensis]|uniref:Probable glycerol kinase n=1 Tax=Zootermopsis nevadensis TaxID=136037 RepID=A0A067QXW3_ZOONE|nr:glycerol kinase isoform X2 [Zootermopsis nevadensis]XP_021928131.1 glycerol kinase isoform X2 [Zootermopsis nevadensis]KDR15118.1 Putative glycerol kinase 3 [Zootermopsis nevadensis]